MNKKTLIFALFLAFGLVALPYGGAEAATPGELIKGSSPTIYYYANDGKRYAFPDEVTYRSWYDNFAGLRAVSDKELNKIDVGGVVTVRPGVRPVTFKSVNRVYGVAKGGQLRWIKSAEMATVIYGADWAKKVLTLNTERMADYSIGTDVTERGQYWWMRERDSALTIWDDRAASNGSGRVVFVKTTPTATLVSANPLGDNGRLIVIPELIRDNGSSSTMADVRLWVDKDRIYPEEGNMLAPGGYTVYIDMPNFKVSEWRGDCSKNGAVYVPKGKTVVCRITIDDITEPTWGALDNRPPKLTLYGPKGVTLVIGTSPNAPPSVSGFSTIVNPGDYTVYASTSGTWSGDCSMSGTITMRKGDEKQCIFER